MATLTRKPNHSITLQKAGATAINEASVRYTSPPHNETEEQSPISPSKIEQRLRSLSGLDSMKIKVSLLFLSVDDGLFSI